MSLFPCNHLVLISSLWNLDMICLFIKFTQWTHTCFEQNMFFLYKNVEINLDDLKIPFDYSKNEV
jgi:hypothetical protein